MLRKIFEAAVIFMAATIIGIVGVVLLATQVHGETLFDQVVVERDEYFQAPAVNMVGNFESFPSFDITSAKMTLSYKGFNYGVHDSGSPLGVAVYLMFRDVGWNPAYEAYYSVYVLPEYSENGSFEISLNDEYFETVVRLSDQWRMTVVYEILIDEYNHPFPKNPGFDKVSISVNIEGNPVQTSNEDASFGYVKMLYR